jgi:hypothetical protein
MDRTGTVVGAGCLIEEDRVLTCHHVVQAATGQKHVKSGARMRVRLCGAAEPVDVNGQFECHSSVPGFPGDMATVKITLPRGYRLTMSDTEFATPYRHGGKNYSVVGFTAASPDGYYASGVMRGPDVKGLVQLDGESPILVQPGFSGAPVWSSDVGAYVGIVVGGIEDHKVAWCIPSRLLCRFYERLPVRFRVPRIDRPDVHDFGEDDPNVPLFGSVSDNGKRRLTVTEIEKVSSGYRIHVRYECLRDKPRGRFVTFITHPVMSKAHEDAYELFSEIEDGAATNYFWSKYAFTVAAIGDAGDTALTYDVAKSPLRPKGMR